MVSKIGDVWRLSSLPIKFDFINPKFFYYDLRVSFSSVKHTHTHTHKSQFMKISGYYTWQPITLIVYSLNFFF